MSGRGMRAKLVSKTLTAPGLVEFAFNPEQVSVVRSVTATNRGSVSQSGGSPAGASGLIFRRATASKITIDKILFRGDTIKLNCDQLLNWMSPGGGMLGAIAGAALSAATGGAINLATKLPLLMFSWGPPGIGFMYDVHITNCTVIYERFNAQGIPIRARVNLTMQEQPSLLGTLPTNPTSGGPPGRRRHVVGEGDTLQSIASANYGSPQRWRWLAEANGIDDPMRLRPGDVLFLPHPDEVMQGAAT